MDREVQRECRLSIDDWSFAIHNRDLFPSGSGPPGHTARPGGHAPPETPKRKNAKTRKQPMVRALPGPLGPGPGATPPGNAETQKHKNAKTQNDGTAIAARRCAAGRPLRLRLLPRSEK